MGADHNVFAHMPEAPPSSPQVRDVAIKRALERFDRNTIANTQGSARDPRLMWRTASSRPSHRRPAMPRMRLIAASLVCLLAGSSTFFYLAHSPDRIGPLTAEKLVASADVNRAPATPPAAASESAGQAVKADRNRVAATPARGEFERQVATWLPSLVAPPPATGETKREVAMQPFAVNPFASRTLDHLARPSRGYQRAGYALAPDEAVRNTPATTPPVSAEPIGRDQFAGASETPSRSCARPRLDLLHRCRHGVLFVRARSSIADVLPPQAADTEEFINYFPYAYERVPPPQPNPSGPRFRYFRAPGLKAARSFDRHQGYAVQPASRPRANLVFLIDTSGSMDRRTGCRWSSSRSRCCSRSSSRRIVLPS